MVEVPSGHKVTTYGGSFSPSVGRAPGGFLIARSGADGDDPVGELSGLLDQIDEQLGASPAVLATHAGTLDGLFAPNNPVVQQVDSAAVVFLQAGSLAGWTEEPQRLEGLLGRLRALHERTLLYVFVEGNGDDVPAQRIVPLMLGLGIHVRTPAADGTILVEVRRPEGVVLCALTGSPVDVPAAPTEGDLRRHAARVAGAEPERAEAPIRAVLLRRRLLEVVKEGEARRRGLRELLLARKRSLALFVELGSSGEARVTPRVWPGLGSALPVYPDLDSLHRSAKALALAPGSYGVAAMTPRELFAWAASIDCAIAMGVFEEQQDGTARPWYVAFELSEVRALAAAPP